MNAIAPSRRLDEILRLPLTQPRIALTQLMQVGQMSPQQLFSLTNYLTQDPAAKAELPKVMAALAGGAFDGAPNLQRPSCQLLWASALIFLTTNPDSMKAWPKPLQAENLWQSKLWGQLVESPRAHTEMVRHAFHIAESVRNSDTRMGWGPPGSWFYFDPQNNRINIDFLYSLVAGFEHSRAVIMHEIGHSELTVAFPARMGELKQQIDDIKERTGSRKMTQADYKAMRRADAEWQLYMRFFNSAEDNVVNRFATTMGDRGVQDYGYSLNQIVVTIAGTGPIANRSISRDKQTSKTMPEDKPGDDTAMKRFENICRLCNMSFFQNNGLMPDSDDAWRTVGVNPDWIRALPGVTPPHADAMEELKALCRGPKGLENLQPDIAERIYGPDWYDALAQDMAGARNRICDDIWRRFLQPLVDEILIENDQKVEQDLKNRQDKQKQKNQQKQQGQQGDQGDPQDGDGDGEGDGEDQDADGQSGQSGQKQKQKKKQKGQKGQKGQQGQQGDPGDDADGEGGEGEDADGEDADGQSGGQPSSKQDGNDGQGQKGKGQKGQKGQKQKRNEDGDAVVEVEDAEDQLDVEDKPDSPQDGASPGAGNDADGQDADGQGQDGQDGDMDGAGRDRSLSDLLAEDPNEGEDGKGKGQDGQDADGQGGGQSGDPSEDPGMPSNKAGQGAGRILNDLTVGDWTNYLESVKQYQGIIAMVAVMLKKIQEHQRETASVASRSLTMLPKDDELSRFNVQAHQDLITKQRGGQQLDQDDLNRFNDDEETTVPTEADVAILIDGSGSMMFAPAGQSTKLETAVQFACILFEAAKRVDMNVYIMMWGPEHPVVVAKPGDDPVTIGKAIQTVRKGLQSGTQLAPSVRAITHEMAENRHRRPGAMTGFSHVIVVSDGDIDDPDRAAEDIGTLYKNCRQVTVDVAVLANRDTAMDRMAGNVQGGRPEQKIGTVHDVDPNQIPMSLIGMLLTRLRQAKSFAAVPKVNKRRSLRKAATQMKENARRSPRQRGFEM